MKVKLPRRFHRHLINCQEMAVWNTLNLRHGVIPLSGNEKTLILSLNNKQGLTFVSLPPEHLSVLGGGFWGGKCQRVMGQTWLLSTTNHTATRQMCVFRVSLPFCNLLWQNWARDHNQ